jgi:cathepsin D
MAYPSASFFKHSSVFQTLVAQGKVPEPVFAFYLAQSNAELFIGGVNKSHYTGSFSYVPVEKQVRI